MTTYTCKECGKPVERRKDGEFVRADCPNGQGCNAPIVAHLKAHATGESRVAQGAPAR